jgi:hypothetical protein
MIERKNPAIFSADRYIRQVHSTNGCKKTNFRAYIFLAFNNKPFRQIINGMPAAESRQLFDPAAVSKNPKVGELEGAT